MAFHSAPARENMGEMTAKPNIDRKPPAGAGLNLAPRRTSVATARKPQTRFLKRIARRLKALRAINRVGVSPNVVNRDDLVKAWTASYFLPMLKGKEIARQERVAAVEVQPDEELLSEKLGVRKVPRPKKGLRLPRLFAPCKKFEPSW